MPRVLYIVRHGNTFGPGDIVRRVGCRTDIPLSASGLAQAENLALYFTDRGIEFSKIFSAPLKRTLQTAQTIALAQPRPCSPVHLTDLAEIDYGPDENKPEREVVERLGKDALDLWDEHAIPPDGWEVTPSALKKIWRGFFNKLATDEQQNAIILAVTSNGVARFALDAAQSCNGNFPKKLRTGAFGEVNIDDQGYAYVERWDVRP